MTATNHALSGALIGAFLPFGIAIPLAFLSHFILDMLPHYGVPNRKQNVSTEEKIIVISDTIIALSIAGVAAYYHKWHMEIVGWVAYSPDITWVFHYFKHHRNLQIKPMNRFMKFHKSIQKFERPWGIWVDGLVALIMLPIFIWQL